MEMIFYRNGFLNWLPTTLIYHRGKTNILHFLDISNFAYFCIHINSLSTKEDKMHIEMPQGNRILMITFSQ